MTLKKQIRLVFLGVLAILAVVTVSNSFFIVKEDECAILKRFGSIQKVFVKSGAAEIQAEIHAYPNANFSHVSVREGAGVYFKVPFVDSVTKFSNKLMQYNSLPQQIIASNKNKLLFDNNAQWYIVNPLFFEITMGNISAAETRIDDIMYSRMREKIGKLESSSVISDKELIQNMLIELTEELNSDLKPYGLRANDIRIRRTDVPEENHNSIYNRMITERNQMAAQYRSEGEEESIKIRSLTDKNVTVILSEAEAEAEILMGEGDAHAAQIFNETYSKNPGFFEFYNMLEMYKATLKREGTTLVIPLDSPFAKYLLGVPEKSETPSPAAPDAE